MNSIRKFIPRFMKYPLIALYILWKCMVRGRTREWTLNLAGVLPPSSSRKIVHGGKVKLLALRERFGDTWKGFNIAYFVSSGLPFAPTIWLWLYQFFGIKIVWNQNGVAYPALYPQRIVDRINSLYKPITLSDHVVYQTKFTKRCADKFVGPYKGPSSILINPVDTKHFKPRLTPLPQEPLTILMAGNHFESKERMLVSLGAIKELHKIGIEAKLIIIGEPEEYTENEIQKLELEDHVKKTGPFLQADAPTLYQSAHILLHLKYLDPCPTIVLEALSSGLPVVGVASGGMPEMVDEKSGVLIPIVEDFENLHYPNPIEVRDAILKIYSELEIFSQNARQGIMKFDKEIWLEKHKEIFQKLCLPSQ